MSREWSPSDHGLNGFHHPVRELYLPSYGLLSGYFEIVTESWLIYHLHHAICNRLWDLAAGRTMAQLTHHHKSVRSLTIHPTEYSFASGSSGGNNIKKWKCPEGAFVHNFSGHDAIINTVAVNEDGVMFSGGKSLHWKSLCLTDSNVHLCLSEF